MGNGILPTQFQLFNDAAVLVLIDGPQVIEKPPATADEFEQALTRSEIFAVRLEVGRELADSFRYERDLNSRTAGIGGMLLKALNGGFFDFFS